MYIAVETILTLIYQLNKRTDVTVYCVMRVRTGMVLREAGKCNRL